MDSSGLAVTLAVAAGVFGAAQVAVMGKLGERIGSLEAVMVAAAACPSILIEGDMPNRSSHRPSASAMAAPKSR